MFSILSSESWGFFVQRCEKNCRRIHLKITIIQVSSLRWEFYCDELQNMRSFPYDDLSEASELEFVFCTNNTLNCNYFFAPCFRVKELPGTSSCYDLNSKNNKAHMYLFISSHYKFFLMEFFFVMFSHYDTKIKYWY